MSQNPTSHDAAQALARQVAADMQASREAQGLEAAPKVDLNFQHAQATPTPLETPTPAPPNLRTTSFAKELDAQRSQENQGGQDQGEQQQGEGSGMVENDKPELKPVNRTREGQAVDRASFNQNWAAEQARADEVNRLAEAVAADMQAAREQPQPEQNRGMGMG